MVYRDPTPLDPERDYTAEELAKFILEKMYGEHTREAMARSLLKANEVAEWAREVAQQLIDGSFDEGALNTAIEQKLNDLEQEYAPQLSTIKNEVEDARGSDQTLGDRLDGVNSQLAQKAKQSDLDETNIKLVMTNNEKIGGGVKAEPEDLSSATLGLITGEGGPIEILSEPQDYSVTPIKTNFLKTVNLVKEEFILVNTATNVDRGEFSTSTTASTIKNMIPIALGRKYVATAGTLRVALYDSDGEYVESISPHTTKSYYSFIAQYNGFARPNFFNEFTEGYTFADGEVFNPTGRLLSEPTRLRNVGYESIKVNSITPELTDFVVVGKNLFDKSRILENTLLRIYSSSAETDSGKPRPNISDYFTSEQFFYLRKNEPITLSNVRIWNLYTLNKILIKGENTDSNTSVVTITPEYDCLLRISGHMSYLDTVQVEKGETATTYSTYNISIKGLNTNDISINPLYQGTMGNLGDSIAAGQGSTLQTYGKIIADKNDMSFHSFAQAGACLGEQETRGKITEQADQLVSSGVNYTHILINGGTNDSDSPLGELTTGYNDVLNKSTVSGGLEYIFKTLKENLPTTKILFVRAHNMSSRTQSSQKNIGETTLAVCKKWSVPYVDLFSEGSLNTNIDNMKNNFTRNSDGTHPTLTAFELFYVPIIENKLSNI